MQQLLKLPVNNYYASGIIFIMNPFFEVSILPLSLHNRFITNRLSQKCVVKQHNVCAAVGKHKRDI